MNGRADSIDPNEVSLKNLHTHGDRLNGDDTNGTNSDYAAKSSGMDSESDISDFSQSSRPETSPPSSSFNDQKCYDEPIAIIGMGTSLSSNLLQVM
jgi:hypothetical protein